MDSSGGTVTRSASTTRVVAWSRLGNGIPTAWFISGFASTGMEFQSMGAILRLRLRAVSGGYVVETANGRSDVRGH
jgi:hypothetical protein